MDERIVKVVILDKRGQEQTAPDSNKAEPAEDSPSGQISSIVNKVVLKSVAKNVAQDIYNMAIYHYEKEWSLTDDYQSQRTCTIALNIIGRSMSIAANAFIGFSVGGPVGLAIATVSSAVDLGFDIYKNLDQQNIRIKQMSEQLEYTRIRVGYSTKAESIGEGK